MSCSNSSIEPLVIPVHNGSFTGTTETHRWISVGVGDPPQMIDFQLSTYDDSMSVADAGACTGINDELQCTADHGGFYISANSSSYQSVSGLEHWNSTHTSNGRSPVRYFNEKVDIEGRAIYGFPMTQFSKSNNANKGYPNVLGLTNSSQFLSTAAASNIAPSGSWGLWIGNEHENGSLIIGGYDEARVSGKFSSFQAFGYNTPYLSNMHILKSITYNAPNGTSTTVLSSPNGEQIGLTPEVVELQMKPIYYQKFLDVTGASYYPSSDQWGWPSGTELGDLTIQFLNDFTVTLPASDLWRSGATGNTTEGGSNETLIVSQVANRTDGLMPNLGILFLQSVYMRFHLEARSFELALANTGPDVRPAIRSFCDSDSTSESTSSSSPSAGAIAGGVIGGVVAALLCALAVWLVLRRKKKQYTGLSPEPPELPSSEKPKQLPLLSELPAVVRYEVPG